MTGILLKCQIIEEDSLYIVKTPRLWQSETERKKTTIFIFYIYCKNKSEWNDE